MRLESERCHDKSVRVGRLIEGTHFSNHLFQKKYMTAPISSSAKQQYFALIRNLLIKATDSYDDNPEIITLDNNASKLLEDFHYQLGHKIPIEYCGFADWAGKLEGTIVRLSGILCLADITEYYEHIPDATQLLDGAYTGPQ